MKEQLREAAKRLLWESGYASMSPRKILDASGAGHGSLYHHYAGKQDLAADALAEIEAEMSVAAAKVFDPDKAPLDRIRDYLLTPRNGLRGCRLGRLANEAEVLKIDELRAPLARYFTHMVDWVEAALKQALAESKRDSAVDTKALATAVVAAVQGGYLLSRAEADPRRIELATRGAWAMIEAAVS